MAQDEAPLYVQFDGETIGDTRYRLGDEVKRDNVPGAVLALLELQGRISSTKPAVSVVMLSDTGKDVGDMSRAELEAASLSAAQTSIRNASDDQLRAVVEKHREASEEAAKEGEADPGSNGTPSDALTGTGASSGEQGGTGAESGEGEGANATYDSLRDKPLAQLRTAELQIVAQAEDVDLSGASTNADRVKAIQDKRDAKAAQ